MSSDFEKLPYKDQLPVMKEVVKQLRFENGLDFQKVSQSSSSLIKYCQVGRKFMF